jgi:hypothetical protein
VWRRAPAGATKADVLHASEARHGGATALLRRMGAI